MNFKTLAIFLSMSMLAPTINDQLDAAQHKKQTKKKKKGIKKHQRRAAPKQPIKLKDEQFMCQQQSCTLPTAQVEVLAATAATPPYLLQHLIKKKTNCL
ncbi:MAG: hypothetical protein KBD31_02345 [Proteobacteria bacterium]|nr:hypothetical protein [Pseudomonadota bacterium]